MRFEEELDIYYKQTIFFSYSKGWKYSIVIMVYWRSVRWKSCKHILIFRGRKLKKRNRFEQNALYTFQNIKIVIPLINSRAVNLRMAMIMFNRGLSCLFPWYVISQDISRFIYDSSINPDFISYQCTTDQFEIYNTIKVLLRTTFTK